MPGRGEGELPLARNANQLLGTGNRSKQGVDGSDTGRRARLAGGKRRGEVDEVRPQGADVVE
jgi:hypothetical protein